MSKTDEKEIEVAKTENSEAEVKIEKNSHEAETEKKDSNKTMIIVMGAVIAVMAVAIVALLIRKPAEEEREPMRNVVVTPDNLDEVIEQINERDFTMPGYYTVNMATEWHFPKGDDISYDARVDNLAENTNNVYFDVFLASDETTPIYQSPVIPIGGFLELIALDVPLEMGTYDCVMIYHLVDDAQETISTLRVAFTIVVES